MEKTVIKFGDIEIEKQKFHQNKIPTFIKNVDINKIVVSNRVSFDKKKSVLNILLAIKMIKLELYVYFSQRWARTEETLVKINKSFLIKDDELLEKYNEIWSKVNISIKKEFDNKPVYNEKYLKGKIKSYNGKINTNFHNNKIPREDSNLFVYQ